MNWTYPSINGVSDIHFFAFPKEVSAWRFWSATGTAIAIQRTKIAINTTITITSFLSMSIMVKFCQQLKTKAGMHSAERERALARPLLILSARCGNHGFARGTLICHALVNRPPFLHRFVTECPLFHNFIHNDPLLLLFRSKFSPKIIHF